MTMKSINPSTGETLKTFEEFTPQQVDQKIQQAADTFQQYRKTSFAERAGCMQRAADILEKKKGNYSVMNKRTNTIYNQ